LPLFVQQDANAMNARELPQHGSAIYALGRNRPLSFHLPNGATVHALSGNVWLTQEKLIEDVVLAPGGRYEARTAGHVVMNAIGESAIVYVELPERTRSAYFSLTTELVSLIEAEARRLRREEIARLLRLAGEQVVRAVRALKGALHRSMNTRPQVPNSQ
jgi:hypothetical protein